LIGWTDERAVEVSFQRPKLAVLARSMGMHAIGTVTKPADLAPAFRSALQVVKSGQPALVDVVTQAR